MKQFLNLLVGITLLASCNNAEKKATDNYQKAKETLLQTETKNPLKFLTVEAKDKKNLIRQTVISGTVTSAAKEALYKDVELELSFYSKTAVLLEKDNETIYEVIKPNSSASFKTKYFAPKGTDSIAVKIISAKIAE